MVSGHCSSVHTYMPHLCEPGLSTLSYNRPWPPTFSSWCPVHCWAHTQWTVSSGRNKTAAYNIFLLLSWSSTPPERKVTMLTSRVTRKENREQLRPKTAPQKRILINTSLWYIKIVSLHTSYICIISSVLCIIHTRYIHKSVYMETAAETEMETENIYQ